MTTLTDQIARRLTFAIISYPDTSRSTLTEKLLVFGWAIQLEGDVEARGAAGPLGLDGDRARTRHLDLLGGDELRARRARLQPPGHAGPPGFQRGHLPCADRGRDAERH
jgi:hypothetical protein